MTIDEALCNRNVLAFLRAIRLGEGTLDDDGYRRMVGGELPTTSRLCQRALKRPRAQSPIHGRLGNAEAFAPCRRGHRFAVECYAARVLTVVVLLFHARPPAVLRRVANVVVDSFKRHLRRGIAHVLVERARVVPSVANRDSATAISMKTRAVRVVTSPHHPAPDAVPARPGAAVRRHGCPRVLFAQATAGTHQCEGEVPIRDDFFRSAIAHTEPPCFAVPRAVKCYGAQATKPLASQILEVVRTLACQFHTGNCIR